MLSPIVGDRFAASRTTTKIATGKIRLAERLVASGGWSDGCGKDEQKNVEQLHREELHREELHREELHREELHREELR